MWNWGNLSELNWGGWLRSASLAREIAKLTPHKRTRDKFSIVSVLTTLAKLENCLAATLVASACPFAAPWRVVRNRLCGVFFWPGSMWAPQTQRGRVKFGLPLPSSWLTLTLAISRIRTFAVYTRARISFINITCHRWNIQQLRNLFQRPTHHWSGSKRSR